MAHDVRLAYVLVGDEPPGSSRVEHEGQHRYTQANLKAALQCMGCKPRLAHKASKSFFLSLLQHLQQLEQGREPVSQPQATLDPKGKLDPSASCGAFKSPFEGFHCQPLDTQRGTGEGDQADPQAHRGGGVFPTGPGEARGGDIRYGPGIGGGGAEKRGAEVASAWKSPGSCSAAEVVPVQKSHGACSGADVALALKLPGSCRGAAAGSGGGSCQPGGLMGNPAQDREPSGCTSLPQNVGCTSLPQNLTDGSEYAASHQQRRELPKLDMPNLDMPAHRPPPDPPDAALPDQAMSTYAGGPTYPPTWLPAVGPAGDDKAALYARVNYPWDGPVGFGMSCPGEWDRVGLEPQGGGEVGGHMRGSAGHDAATIAGGTCSRDAHGSHGGDATAHMGAHVTAHVTVGGVGDRKRGAEGEEAGERGAQRVGRDNVVGAARCAEGGEGVETTERAGMEVEPAMGSHREGAAEGTEGGEGVESRLQRWGMGVQPATGSHMAGGEGGTGRREGGEGVESRLQRLGMKVQPAPGGRVVVAMRRAQFEDLVMEHVACHTDKYLAKADFQVACSVREQRRSVCVMLCGTSGTGKSTLAGLLAARLGITAVVSTDSIRHMLRSFMPREKCPVLWASTYEAAACVPDPSGVPPSEESGAGSTRDPKQRIIAGYKAQSEMVVEKLSALIEGYERRRESVVCEGVHLSLDMVVSLMERHPSMIPFLIIISNEAKHRERFAVRAKYMTMEPKQNRYVAHLRNIRVIQEYLMRKADKHAIPTVNNTNVDRSLATIHGTVVACLRHMARGERLLKPGTRLALPVAHEYQLCKNTTWSSKNTLRVIMQRRGGLNIGGISPPDTPSTSTSSSYAHLSMFADTDDGIDARSFQESDLASGAGSESGSGSDVEDPGAALEERLEGGSVGGESDADEHEDEDLLPFTL